MIKCGPKGAHIAGLYPLRVDQGLGQPGSYLGLAHLGLGLDIFPAH